MMLTAHHSYPLTPSVRQAAEQLTRSTLNLHGANNPPMGFGWRLLNFLRSVETVLASTKGDTQWSLLYSDGLWETISEKLSSGEDLSLLGEAWEKLESVSQQGSDRAMINWPELVRDATEKLRSTASPCHVERQEAKEKQPMRYDPRRGAEAVADKRPALKPLEPVHDQPVPAHESAALRNWDQLPASLGKESTATNQASAWGGLASAGHTLEDARRKEPPRHQPRERHARGPDRRKQKRKAANATRTAFVNYGLL